MEESGGMSGIAVVFFDLGDTLGTATVQGDPPHLAGFQLFPFVLDLLGRLAARGLRLGVISNTGTDASTEVNAILRPTGLLHHLDPTLLVYSADEGMDKSTRQIFDRAADRAGGAAKRCLFVGENPAERAVARRAGWMVCPDPQQVEEMPGVPPRSAPQAVGESGPGGALPA